MKKLFIVGASSLQLPAILKAKEMGLYVAVADYDPLAVGIPYADEFYNVSTIDEDGICEATKACGADGIMTLATDMPMRSVAKASEKLGLHAISYETAIRATDKYYMIKTFKEHDVPSPWYFIVSSLSELKIFQDRLSFPCIMKPTDNAGSHGVVLVSTIKELIDSYEYSLQYSREGNVIIEEYLQGQEVSVEVMVIDGEVHILQITDKLTTGAPYFVEMGHSQPSCHPECVLEKIRQVTISAVQAIGITMGPAHVEMMLTTRGPVMIELGARMGGDNITTHLVPLSTGIDMVQATIKLALGEKPNIEPMLCCGAAIRYFDLPFGVIGSICGVEEAGAIEGIKQITFIKTIGDKSNPIHCSNDRVGFVIAQASSAKDAVCLCEKARKKIKIEIK